MVISKELDFGMFTAAGDAAIYGIIVAAEANNMTPEQVMNALQRLAKQSGFEEATDTAVRETVGCALNFF